MAANMFTLCSDWLKQAQALCNFCPREKNIKRMRRFIVKTPNAGFCRLKKASLWHCANHKNSSITKKKTKKNTRVEASEREVSRFWHGLQKVIKIFSFLFIVTRNSSPGKANQ